MGFPPIRNFSEQTDLLPILQDLNNNEEALKWAWINAFSSVLQREGITMLTPIYKYGRCTEDGTMCIHINSNACKCMHLKPQDGLLGASINLGIEAKKFKTYSSSYESAFAQRVFYDSKIYGNGYNTCIDAICVCSEQGCRIAYKYKNNELYHTLMDFYNEHDITKACTIYKDFPEVRKIIGNNIIWEPMFKTSSSLCIEDIISKIFIDLLNGGNA